MLYRMVSSPKKPCARRHTRCLAVDRHLATVVVWREKKGTSLHIGRTLMTDKITDPVALWQKMVGEMEKGFKLLRHQGDGDTEFSRP